MRSRDPSQSSRERHGPLHDSESSMHPVQQRPPRLSAPGWVLRRLLIFSDLASIAIAWSLVLALVWLADPAVSRPARLLLWLLVASAVTVTVVSREQLYLARIWAIRAVEVQRLGRACLIAALLLAIVDRVMGAPLGSALIGLGSLTAWTMLVFSRTVFQAWVQAARRRGGRGRSLLLVEDLAEGRRVLDLLQSQPELGYSVVGYVAPTRALADLGVPWLGKPVDLPFLTQVTAVTGVLVVASECSSAVLAPTIAELSDLDLHVHTAILDGQQRPCIRLLPLSQRPTLVNTEPALSTVQRVFKRTFDLVAGSVLIVLAMPIVVVAAGLLKVTAGGPVLVRDTRLDPRGVPLVVTRLRTNHLPPNRLATGIAALCRRLCIDELPQLGNVLGGSMSLVGPRPHRPGLTTATPDGPEGVSAGLISLRHVQALEFPELGPHRRADSFYAENWSVGLDLSIVAASVAHLMWRTAHGDVAGKRAGAAVTAP